MRWEVCASGICLGFESRSAVGTFDFTWPHNKAAIWTSPWLGFSQGRAARYAITFANRIGCAAVFTSYAIQARGKLVTGASRLNRLVDDRPNMFGELQVFYILSNIVEAADQAKGILQSGNDCPAERSCGAEPFLLSNLNHHFHRILFE